MDHYAVIGHPISHSRSPLIHAQFAQQTGQDLSYEAIEVAPAALAGELRRLHAEGFCGLNVTLPHKQSVARLCESVSERAQLAGAVNTLIRTATGWAGDNTDGEGFLADLKRLRFAIKDRGVLVMGAGGAARGILGPLLSLGPTTLVVSNRNPWKPEELTEVFKPIGTLIPRTHIALKGDQFDVIINATSAGHQGVMPLLPGPLLARGGVCYDLSYGVAHGPFAGWARKQEAGQIEDGLGMLIEQAASAFLLWRGVRPDTVPVMASVRQQTESDGETEEQVAGHQAVRRHHVELPPQD